MQVLVYPNRYFLHVNLLDVRFANLLATQTYNTLYRVTSEVKYKGSNVINFQSKFSLFDMFCYLLNTYKYVLDDMPNW